VPIVRHGVFFLNSCTPRVIEPLGNGSLEKFIVAYPQVFLVMAQVFVLWLIQFVTMKVDMRYIKDRLRKGDKRLASHSKRINNTARVVQAIATTCSAQHGAVLPVLTDNGDDR